MRLCEQSKLLWAVAPANYTGAAATAKYVSLKNYGHATIAIQTGAWAGGTAAVTVEQATDVSGTGTKTLSFTSYWHDETTSGTLAEATCSDTFDLDTANKLYVIEIDAADLDVANAFDCLSVQIATPGANNDYYSVAYVLSQPRFGSATPPSALVD